MAPSGEKVLSKYGEKRGAYPYKSRKSELISLIKPKGPFTASPEF
jgi:hypothetical protein